MCRLGCDYAGDATSFADSFLRFARAEEAAMEGGDCSHLVGSFARDMPESMPRACGSRILDRIRDSHSRSKEIFVRRRRSHDHHYYL